MKSEVLTVDAAAVGRTEDVGSVAAGQRVELLLLLLRQNVSDARVVHGQVGMRQDAAQTGGRHRDTNADTDERGDDSCRSEQQIPPPTEMLGHMTSSLQ